MDIEILQQLIIIAGETGEGVFWLVIMYLMPKYLTIIGWVVGVIFCIIYLGKIITHLSRSYSVLKEFRSIIPETKHICGELTELEISRMRFWIQRKAKE